MQKTNDLVVTGEIVIDHHIYGGERFFPSMKDARGVRAWRELGGADLVRRLLDELLATEAEQRKQSKPDTKDEFDPTDWRARLGVEAPPINEAPCESHAFALWRPYPAEKGKKDLVWRSDRMLGFGDPENDGPDQTIRRTAEAPASRILVLDEMGFRFRSSVHKDCWLLPDGEKPDWIVLKMSRPVAQGDLWFELTERYADRLVCVISADDLRQECVSLSVGLSWERTIDEMRAIIGQNPALGSLRKCAHLIVRFRTDGALWIDRSKADEPRATLVYDASNAEGIWETRFDGGVAGYSSVLTAALAFTLARAVSAKTDDKIDLCGAIEGGLFASRDLLASGHGRVGKEPPCGFPAKRLAKVILSPASDFSRMSAPFSKESEPLPRGTANWSIVEFSQRTISGHALPSLVGLARQLVLKGERAIKRLPHARFGVMTSVDRIEIETLRSIRRLMLDYRVQERPKKPLSIGVFGPPGAGKSFGVKQLANEVFGKEAWLEFNLAQFDGPADLMGAFHQVRDLVLSGITPVVFWDEFDSNAYKWLQYLLAPMQDGRFQEGQLNHAVGKCVFVFAGGTSATFAAFGPRPEDTEAVTRFRLQKGPDFHSRLDAFYNVLGPNQRQVTDASGAPVLDPSDVCYPLRRALLIRALLGCRGDEQLDFDSDLLDALLLVPKYLHGARSLEKLILQLKPAHNGPVRRSSLPSAAQLAMHVDAGAFADILNRNEAFRISRAIEPMATAIHETWRALAAKDGWKMQPHLDKPYAELAEIDKEDNRAAARRIPDVLALAGMGITDAKTPASRHLGNGEIQAHLVHHLERLSEAEHDGWMEHRIKNGWTYRPMSDYAKHIHKLLIPYEKLPEIEKDKDRNAVRHYPQMVKRAGYRIVWL